MAQTARTKTQPSPTTTPQAEQPHRGLTEIQEELAELTSDILLNGGAQADVDPFLRALNRHRSRRFQRYLQTRGETEKDVVDNEKHIEYWSRELMKTWQSPKVAKRSKKPAVSSSPVLEIARADIRGRLKGEFEEFIRDSGGIESAYLLNEILEYVNSGGEDMPYAFARYMETNMTYVKIPDEMEEEVRNFVALLEKRTP